MRGPREMLGEEGRKFMFQRFLTWPGAGSPVMEMGCARQLQGHTADAYALQVRVHGRVLLTNVLKVILSPCQEHCGPTLPLPHQPMQVRVGHVP